MVILHLQLLQNIGYIPHAVQNIPVTYLPPSSLHPPAPSLYCPTSLHW